MSCLRGEPRVARAHRGIGDERLDREGGELLQIRFAVIARVGGAVRLRLHDDLPPRIDGRHAGVSLDHTLVRGHLRSLIICAITLPESPRRSAPIRGVRGEPVAELRRVPLDGAAP